MKKITFLFLFALINTLNAQNVIWSDNFDDLKIEDWTLLDADNDKKNWYVAKHPTKYVIDPKTQLVKITEYANAIASKSVIETDEGLTVLKPDNYIISPKIDLSNTTGIITLKWKVRPTAPDYDQENYSVYVAESKEKTKLLASSVKKEGLTTKGIKEFTEIALDISAFAGKSEVYVAFRHHNSTDQEAVLIDDVSVESDATASIKNLELTNVKFSYNSNELRLTASNVTLDNAEVFNILGKRTLNQKLSSKSESINISNLNSGIYILRVSAQGKYKTFKFVK